MNWRINTYGTNKLPPEKSFRIIDFNRMFRRFNTKSFINIYYNFISNMSIKRRVKSRMD